MPPAKPTPRKSTALKTTSRTPSLEATSASGTFGVMLEINGTPITIDTSQLSTIKTEGLSFNYDPDEPTTIGSLTTLVGWISTNLHVSIPLTDLEAMPVIGPAVTFVASLEVTVSQFDVSIAGTGGGTNSFNLQGTIEVPVDKQPSLFGLLKLTGFAFGVTYPSGS